MSAIPVSIGARASAEPVHFLVSTGADGDHAATTYGVQLFDLGLACCAVEFAAATSSYPDVLRLADDSLAEGSLADGSGETLPHTAEVMVISGTVTDKMAPTVKRIYDELPEPKYVISFGSCASSGGPYWDSYCVTKGVDQMVPVDVYVPGCPPRPEALLYGLRLLQEQIAAAAGKP